MKTKFFFGTVAAVMLAACGGGQPETESQSEVPSYEIIKLKPVTRAVTYSFPATLTGLTNVNLFPQVQGRIVARHYENGVLVKKGQPLIEIDPVQFRLKVESDEANVKAAEAALSTAKLQYDSQKKLFEKKIVSEYVMKTAENSYLTAQAQLAQAKAALDYSRTDLAHCTVVAPITGIVKRMHDNEGTLVAPSMGEPMVTITDQVEAKAKFSIVETLYTELFRELDIVATGNGYRTRDGNGPRETYSNIYLRLKDGEMYSETGKFHSIDGVVDANTGTVTVEVVFPNPNLVLHAGNSASVILPDTIHDAIVIPQTACKKLQDKYLAFKVNAQGETVGTLIDVTPTDDGKEYIVHKGLKEGDEIVAKGVNRIMEGQKVKP